MGWGSTSNSKGDSVGEGLVGLRIGAITQQLRTQQVKNLGEVASALRGTAARVCRLPEGCIAVKRRIALSYQRIRVRYFCETIAVTSRRMAKTCAA
jgi:hypothetical protein